MSFGLKNVGAIYQCVMQRIINDMLHKNVECYVDDLVVKSRKRKYHLKNLCMVLIDKEILLKMNPLKCVFGVNSGKFLRFIVQHCSIEVD